MNKLFIISGPSGSGQDSVIEGLKKYISIERVVTTTTRPMRVGEKEGHPYYFISKKEFKKGIKEKKFFEWAKEYNNNYYGVTFNEIKRVGRSKKVGIWKIEYKGVLTAKKLIPEIIAILINAPFRILRKRIKERDNASVEFINKRMEYTKKWMRHKNIYDYEVQNEEGKLNKAILEVKKIIENNLKQKEGVKNGGVRYKPAAGK